MSFAIASGILIPASVSFAEGNTMPSDNPIDRFFDKVEEVLDGTIPAGRLGFAAVAYPRFDSKKGPDPIVWHFALYKTHLICDENLVPTNQQYHERLPRGTAFAFCGNCLRKALEELKDG